MLNGEVIWQANWLLFSKERMLSLSLSYDFYPCLSRPHFLSFSLSFYALRTVWPDLAKFHHFGKMSKVFGNFLER